MSQIETKAATGQDIDIIFQSLWQRRPSHEERAANINRPVADIISDIRKTPAFAEHLPNLMEPYTLRYGRPHVGDTHRFSEMLAQSALSPDACHSMIMAKYQKGDYYDFHKARFQELHGFLARIDQERPIGRLLEISTMPYTTGIWKEYLKSLEFLAAIDLLEAQGGPSRDRVMSYGADKHVEVDLNKADLESLADTLIEGGGYDVIIATEVVEHLQKDFSEIARFMFKCLAPGGVAIVTTPNAVSEMHLLYVFNGKNPYQRFLGYNANHGGHMHFREYTMTELVEDVAKVNAGLFMQVYSACWRDDATRFATEDRYHLRQNNVILFGRQEDEHLWRQ